MNTLQPITRDDLYVEHRAAIQNNSNSIDSMIQELDTQMIKPQEKQLQGSQNIPDVANPPSAGATAQEKKKSTGVMGFLDWATSPLQALGDAALAPIADKEYPNTGLADNTAHAFKVSGKALMNRLFPVLGEEHPDYGKLTVDTHMQSLPEWSKPVVATGISLATDPTVTLGIGAAKVFQEGMKAKKIQEMSGEVKNTGVWEEGVGKLLGLDGAYDPDKLTNIGQLAQKADRGDMASFQELQNHLQDQKVAELMNAVDLKATINKVNVYKQAFGDPSAPMVVWGKSQQEHEFIQSTLKSNAVPGQAFNINISKLNTQQEIDVFFDQVTKHYSKVFENEVGKPHTEAFVKAGAQVELLEDLLGRRTANFDDKQAFAIRQGLMATGNTFRMYARRAEVSKDPIDIAAANKAFFLNLAVMQKTSGVASDAGRLLRSFRIQADTNRGMYKQVRDMIDSPDTDSRFLKSIRAMASDEQLDPRQLTRLLEKAPRAWQTKIANGAGKAYDALYEVYVNSILSGPLTHAVNITSNASMVALRPSEQYIAALSAGARSIFNPLAKTEFASQLKQANAMTAGLVGGVADVFRVAVGRASKHDINMPEELLEMHELARQKVKPQITSDNLGLTGALGSFTDYIGNIIRLPGEALLKEDKAFKLINYRMTINQEAARKAVSAGGGAEDAKAVYQAMRNNPDERMVEQAMDMASLYTFTKKLEGSLGKVEQALRAPGINLLVPFFRTPVNIVKMGVGKSFVGNFFNDFITGDFVRNTPKGDLARAKMAIGTLLPASIVGVMSDRVTGRGDLATEKGQLKAEFQEPPYSIRVGDNWFSYERLEPARSVLGMMTNYADAINALNQADPDDQALIEEIASVTITPFLQTIGDNSFFDVFGHIHWLLEGAMSGDYEGLGKQATKMAASMVVPNLVAQTNTMAFDEKYRMAEGLLENIHKRIWGLSKELPIRPNAFGDPQFVPRGVPFSIVNPFLTRPSKNDIVANKLIELGVDPGEITPKEFTHEGINLKLNTQQRSDFGVMVGRGIKADVKNGLDEVPPMRDVIGGLLKDSEFKKYPPEIQKMRIEGLYRMRKDAIKNYMINVDPVLRAKYEEARTAIELNSEGL